MRKEGAGGHWRGQQRNRVREKGGPAKRGRSHRTIAPLENPAGLKVNDGMAGLDEGNRKVRILEGESTGDESPLEENAVISWGAEVLSCLLLDGQAGESGEENGKLSGFAVIALSMSMGKTKTRGMSSQI